MSTQLFQIGQSVRILPGIFTRDLAADVFTVLRCNEPDSANPSYVIESADRRQRRELHCQLQSVTGAAGS